MGELVKVKGGTKMYNPPRAVPILGLASDGRQTFLTGGGGGSTASKEVPNQVQIHQYDAATGKVTTAGTLNTEKSVTVHLSHVAAKGLWIASLQAGCKLLQIAEDGASLKELCQWTTEDKGRQPEVNVARASAAGDVIATGGTDGCVRMWKLASNTEAPKLHVACAEHPKNEILDVDFSPDGELLVSCERGGPCRLWSAASGEEKSVLKYEKSGKALALKSARFILHAELSKQVLVIAANAGPRDPSYLAIFGTDGKQLGEVKVDKLPITAMGVDDIGQHACVTLASGTKKVFALPSLRLVQSIAAVHDLPAPAIAFVGDMALSGGGDRTVHLLPIGGGGGGMGSALLYMTVLLAILAFLFFLLMRIGLKGASLQQGEL